VGQRTIPDPGFADDDGSTDPALAAAIHSGDSARIVERLAAARLLVPVIATGAVIGHGENDAVVALVTIEVSDGRKALPAFTSLDALGAWNAAARPVPAAAPVVAATALAEGAHLVILDPAGPIPFELAGPALWAVAERRPLLPPRSDPAVIEAVRAITADESEFVESYLAPADDRTDLRLQLIPKDPAQARAAAERIARRLADTPIIRARVGRGVEIIMADHGLCRPGLDLLSLALD
jgi:SseB protein N-terminal domain